MDKASKKVNIILIVVVVAIVLLLISLSQRSTSKQEAEAGSLIGTMKIACYNGSVKNTINYNAKVVPIDNDGSGLPDRFGVDAFLSGESDFSVYTGDFNPKEIDFNNSALLTDDVNLNNGGRDDVALTVVSVLLHQLDVLDSKISGLFGDLLDEREGSLRASEIKQNLDNLLKEEDRILEIYNLMPNLLGVEGLPIACASLGLEQVDI